MNFLQTKARVAAKKIFQAWGLIVSATTGSLTLSREKKNQTIEGVFTPAYLRGGEPQQEFFPEEEDCSPSDSASFNQDAAITA